MMFTQNARVVAAGLRVRRTSRVCARVLSSGKPSGPDVTKEESKQAAKPSDANPSAPIDASKPPRDSSSNNATSASSNASASGPAQSEWGFAAHADTLEHRVRAAKQIQALVREGYASLDARHFLEAADTVSQLPSGSLARRYLSGFIMNGHGNLVSATAGDSAQAGELLAGAFEHAVAEASEGLGDDRYSDIVSFASDLAVNHANAGRLSEAEKLLKRALYWVSSSRVEPDRPLLVATLTNLGQVQLLQGRSAAALDTQERALVESSNVFGEDNVAVRAALLVHLAAALRLEDIAERAAKTAVDAEKAARAALKHTRGDGASGSETGAGAVAQGALAQASRALAAALVTRGVMLVAKPDCEREDVQRAAALAGEALELDYAPRAPALLLAGLCADEPSGSEELFARAVEAAEEPVVARAARHNVAMVARLRSSSSSSSSSGEAVELELEHEKPASAENEALRKRISRLEAARHLLYRVPLGSDGGYLWVQGQSAFVCGLTLRQFCKEHANSA